MFSYKPQEWDSCIMHKMQFWSFEKLLYFTSVTASLVYTSIRTVEGFLLIAFRKAWAYTGPGSGAFIVPLINPLLVAPEDSLLCFWISL